MADTTSSTGLRRDAIGLREVLFQSITHMAPAAAVAFSIIVGAQFASGALPLSGATDRPRIRGLGTVFGAEELPLAPAPAERGAAATPVPEAVVDA
jgi:hypothetical protein